MKYSASTLSKDSILMRAVKGKSPSWLSTPPKMNWEAGAIMPQLPSSSLNRSENIS